MMTGDRRAVLRAWFALVAEEDGAFLSQVEIVAMLNRAGKNGLEVLDNLDEASPGPLFPEAQGGQLRQVIGGFEMVDTTPTNGTQDDHTTPCLRMTKDAIGLSVAAIKLMGLKVNSEVVVLYNQETRQLGISQPSESASPGARRTLYVKGKGLELSFGRHLSESWEVDAPTGWMECEMHGTILHTVDQLPKAS